MANPQDMPEVPDLDEFARKIEEAAAATQEFVDQASRGSGGQQEIAVQATTPKDDPIQRDILNALHLIHDELVALKQIIENMTG
jgi:hypothetical protein